MIVQACHVEVEEEPFWDVDDEFSDSDDWESWHEMRLDVLYNEKVYKDVESGFYMWKERMIEVTPSTKSDEEA